MDSSSSPCSFFLLIFYAPHSFFFFFFNDPPPPEFSPLPLPAALPFCAPFFLVSSGEAGRAGLCPRRPPARAPGVPRPPLLQEQEILLTDGPTMFAPGTLDVA